MCKVLSLETYGYEHCPGWQGHEMPQSNYSKDLHAGSDFMGPAYNCHDATKCVWNLQMLVEVMHAEDRLPAVRLRFGPSNTEEAEQRVNSWDAMRRVPLANVAPLGPEGPLSRPEPVSMRQMYRNAMNKFWRWGDCKSWSAIMKEVAEGPMVDANGSEYWRCILCSGSTDKHFVGGHWTSDPHFNAVRGRHQRFVRHEWDEAGEKWTDIMQAA